MIIMRSNPLGGRPLNKGTFPLHEDKEGNFGLLIGYWENGDKLLIPMSLADEFACRFALSLEDFKKRMSSDKTKEPLRHRIIKLLGGKVEN